MHITDFQKYIDSEKRFSVHTVTSYTTDLNQFILFLSQEYNIDNITEVSFQIVRSWISSLLEKGLAPRSVNRKISTLKTYFNFLLKTGVILESPMQKVISPKTSKRLPVYIEQDKMNALLNKEMFEETFEGERDRMILALFYATGIRLSELVNLKLQDIDSINNQIKVLGKRNKERIIPLSKNTIEFLVKFIQKNTVSQYLFTSFDGKKLYPKKVYRIVKKHIGMISSKDKRSPHVLRHTFATHMLNNGADINAIKELLGHANLSATQIYTHNTIDKLKNVYKQAHPRA